jgi:hypothetical protein
MTTPRLTLTAFANLDSSSFFDPVLDATRSEPVCFLDDSLAASCVLSAFFTDELVDAAVEDAAAAVPPPVSGGGGGATPGGGGPPTKLG